MKIIPLAILLVLGNLALLSGQVHLEKNEKIYAPEEVDKEATLKNADKIFSQISQALDCPEGGKIKLTLALHESGKVTEVKVESSEGCKMIKPADVIVRKLRFSPAIKDGLKVSQSQTLEIQKEFKSEGHVIQN